MGNGEFIIAFAPIKPATIAVALLPSPRAGGTANLGPGFDCLGAALDLYNEFIFTRIEGGGDRFDLIMESTDGNHLRGGPENLVFRAAQKVWESAKMDPFALEARVKLAVPPARGLGSSATAIVAGLIGANAIMNSPLSK